MTYETATSVLAEDIIINKIYFLRGHKVMLDSDLASLYEVETKHLKRQVKRNIERFPDDFMFELTKQEYDLLRSQIGTSSWGGARYLPIAFTEQGIAMLSSVLSGSRAIAVNIQIMRIFTRVRQMLTDNTELRLEIEQIKKKLSNQSQNIELVFQYLDELTEKKEEPTTRKRIGYKPDEL